MRREFASVIEKRGKWYVALVEETPGVKRSERGCELLREGARHSIYFNPKTDATSSPDMLRSMIFGP